MGRLAFTLPCSPAPFLWAGRPPLLLTLKGLELLEKVCSWDWTSPPNLVSQGWGDLQGLDQMSPGGHGSVHTETVLVWHLAGGKGNRFGVWQVWV